MQNLLIHFQIYRSSKVRARSQSKWCDHQHVWHNISMSHLMDILYKDLWNKLAWCQKFWYHRSTTWWCVLCIFVDRTISANSSCCCEYIQLQGGEDVVWALIIKLQFSKLGLNFRIRKKQLFVCVFSRAQITSL